MAIPLKSALLVVRADLTIEVFAPGIKFISLRPSARKTYRGQSSRRSAMRYSQWRAFDAVARELSFSRAAARLGITQPAVTLQVRALESACAMTLFRRHGAQIALTDAGRTLLGLTRRMFAVEDEIREFL